MVGRAPSLDDQVAQGLQTRAEASGFTETSRYNEVMALLTVAASVNPDLHLASFGETVEGRELPLVVWGAEDASAEAVHATGTTRVLLFANIHAGEVCGKEALQMLVRDLAQGRHAAWADSLVLLIAPIYNADGNERIAYDNRRLQLGPVGGMGQRPNAQGLDLNRDFVKLAAPESRALVGLMRDYDPHVLVDLHTTNGTVHAYHLTYAPPLHPNTPAALDTELREHWLPRVTERIATEDGWALEHYGNVPGAFGEPATVPRAWYSFDARPRFGTNYAGLRGRFGILSEAYSYASFEERIRATKRFVEEIVDYAHDHAAQIRALTGAADATSVVGDSLALRATWDALPEPVEILLGAADTVRHPVTNAPMLQRRDVRRPESMPAYIRFAPTERERAPAAYALPMVGEEAEAIRTLLDHHGIRYEIGLVWGIERERFRIDSVRVAEREFQGVRGQEVFGQWEAVAAEEGSPPRMAGSLIVPLDQPLGRLAFTLFEPRSDDGLVAWAFFSPEQLRPSGLYPVERIHGALPHR